MSGLPLISEPGQSDVLRIQQKLHYSAKHETCPGTDPGILEGGGGGVRNFQTDK